MITTAPLPVWAILKWPDDEWGAELVLAWSEGGEPLVWCQDTGCLEPAAADGTLWDLIADAAWESATDRIRAAIAAAKGWGDA